MIPIVSWNFDEASGPVLDNSGHGGDFTLTSPTIRTSSGHTNGGLTQAGSDIQLAPSSVLAAVKTSQRTIAAWIKETTPETGWIGEMYVSSIDSGSWGILFLSNQWHIQARNAGGFVRCSVARPTDSLFHHVVGTYDGVNVKMYLDGSLVATQPLAAPMRTDADQLRILDNTSSSITVDDLQYFDTAATPAEIATIMTTPVIPVRSGKAKIWDGSNWIQYPVKVWDGSSWIPAKLKAHNGADWIVAK
jgi:hypothetical protein